MNTSIVLGLGYGDEGKGLTTSYLCSLSKNSLVVRFNGGHQAGHTVVHNRVRHIFSSFGSGTLLGVPTFWSKFCTFYPIAVLNEYAVLKEKGIEPKLYVDPLSPVTTPFDISDNQESERDNQHGSVGVGFGSTLKRQEAYYKLYFQDLFFPSVLKEKLDHIIDFYYQKIYKPSLIEEKKQNFIRVVETLKKQKFLHSKNDMNFFGFDHIIFEGAQGILLDIDFGFFPNVTRSNTTSKNAIQIIKENDLDRSPEIYYVTRSYQTRHDKGFMTNEGSEEGSTSTDKYLYSDIKQNEKETNIFGTWQGKFRKGILDIEMLNYALTCDMNFSSGYTSNLVVTCLDQTGDEFLVIHKGIQKKIHITRLKSFLHRDFDKTIYNYSDSLT